MGSGPRPPVRALHFCDERLLPGECIVCSGGPRPYITVVSAASAQFVDVEVVGATARRLRVRLLADCAKWKRGSIRCVAPSSVAWPDAAPGCKQYRDPLSGQFAHDGRFDRLCVCGHELGDHVAGGFDCNVPMDGGLRRAKPCDCVRFRASRAKDPYRAEILRADGSVHSAASGGRRGAG